MNTIVANTCAVLSPSFEFILKGEFCMLDWKYDVKPLTQMYEEISQPHDRLDKTWLNI